jgi:protein arginine N-methyltransferase 1
MGYLLLYESMLSTVLYARDKWLAPGGVVHPSRARVLCAGLDTQRWHAPQREFWRNVYGFDFSSMLQPWPRAVVGDEKEPLVEVVDGDAMCTDEACLRVCALIHLFTCSIYC